MNAVEVRTGISGAGQEGSFGNATLQGVYEGIEFSIATHIEVPDDIPIRTRSPEAVTSVGEYLKYLLTNVNGAFPNLTFEVEVGVGGEEDDEHEGEEDSE